VSMKFFEKFGLTSRLVFWFAVISLASIVTVAMLSFSAAEKSLENEASNKLLSINDAVESNIVTYFKEKSLKYEALADNPIFEGDRKDLIALKAELERVKKSQGQLYDLFIIDVDGKIIASTDQRERLV